MHPLGPTDRLALAALACAAFGAAFVTAPTSASGAIAAAAPRVALVAPAPRRNVAGIPLRDPFARIVGSRRTAAAPAPSLATTFPQLAGSAPRVLLAPPLAGAPLPPAAPLPGVPVPPAPFPPAAPYPAAQPQPPHGAPLAARVTAVILGAHPLALVDDGTPRIVSVGQRLGGARVAGIDGAGIRLDDGSVLAARPETAGAAR